MAAFRPKENTSFSIPAEVEGRLEAVQRVQKALDEIRRPATNDETGTVFLHRKRMEWDGRPIQLLEG